MTIKNLMISLLITTVLILFTGCAITNGLFKSKKTYTDPWKLAIQTYSFRAFTLMEAIEKAKEAGIGYIEAYPGQKFSREKMDIKVSTDLAPELRNEIKAKLKENGVELVSFYATKLSNDEKECRKVFDFAKDMGIKTIVSEPKEDALVLIDKLCNEYNIKVAIHNHPIPSRYWNPDIVLKAFEGKSKMLGACGDIGHWARSGIKPVNAIKKLRGRLISLHLKDISKFGNGLKKHKGLDVEEDHDLPFGTGKMDIGAVLKELKQQKFKGVVSIEYEYNHENPLPDVKKCVEYYNKTIKELMLNKMDGRK